MGHGAHDNLLFPNMKWTAVYNTGQKISQKSVKIKGTLGLIKPECIN